MSKQDSCCFCSHPAAVLAAVGVCEDKPGGESKSWKTRIENESICNDKRVFLTRCSEVRGVIFTYNNGVLVWCGRAFRAELQLIRRPAGPLLLGDTSLVGSRCDELPVPLPVGRPVTFSLLVETRVPLGAPPAGREDTQRRRTDSGNVTYIPEGTSPFILLGWTC